MRTASSAKVAIFGAGGHGRVVAESAFAAGLLPVGFLDDALDLVGEQRDGLPVLGGLAWLSGAEEVAVLLGVGSNAAREAVARRVRAAGARMITVVHPSAVVSRHAEVGEGSVILALAVVNSGARIGIGAIVNSGAIVEHDATVEDFAHVSPNATLSGGASIRARSHVGVGACVLPERVLGECSILGAGGVLVKDIPAYSVAVGAPARVIRAVHERVRQ